MKYMLAYGTEYLPIEIPEQNLLGVVESRNISTSTSEKEIIGNALKNCIDSDNLSDIITRKAAQNAVIVVNDITRPTPYKAILPPLLKEIEKAGIPPEKIKLVVATGIHRPHTQQDNLNIFGEEICSGYSIENHNCDTNLKLIGYLSNGMRLIINKTVAEADLLVTTGVVALHYFAGYSGGRKSILPGVAARELIEANHQMMNDERACLGNYTNNPVSDIMLEAARMTGVDFILNVVTGSHHEAVFCAAGDLYEAWIKAVEYCQKLNVVDIADRADIVIAGCGGYPKDINMYQAQKALDAAVLAVKPGGIIILAAECREGLGEKTFADWLDNAHCPEDIYRRFNTKFELGGHKAYAICRVLKRADIVLVSKLNDETVRKMFLQPAKNIQEAINMAIKKCGSNAKIIFMPEASRLAVKIVRMANNIDKRLIQ